ncbi:initiator tRNA phosphoribosyl transferase [Calocera viscosa TUFC12733]|uniref:Initiator tRNA phosphoribosyl transferase n=1 Tax=Calocera viscosa (strain TUFC12733) TaxID=1330018 RepID=A0A167FPB6_CALVF|nr:initiator tRNA phosphoribosyl transferase [Calocera viscosa TUFC12733]
MSSRSSFSSTDEPDDTDSDTRATFDDEPDRREDEEIEIHTSVRSQQREIKSQSKDVYNRLRSIATDAAFIQRVREEYPDLALMPNARCGLWYCPLQDGVTTAYFKSTDGHTNNYKFSLRRPNLHVIPIIEEHGGIILVDSTRRGKLFPDALSKTVPIWCAVINTALGFPLPEGQESWLFTPPRSVSPSEHAVISSLIAGFVNSLRRSALVLPMLDKPLRPFWIHPQTTSLPSLASATEREFYPVLCVSASRQVEGTHEGLAQDWGAGWGYVQGAGDDEESWSEGLTPQLYWAHEAQLDTCSRSDLPELIRSLVEHQDQDATQGAESPSPIAAVNGLIAVGRHPLPIGADDTFTVTILASSDPPPTTEPGNFIFSLPSSFKHAQSDFQMHIVPTIASLSQQALSFGRSVVLADDTPNSEWAAPLAVILLQMFFDDNGRCLPSTPPDSALEENAWNGDERPVSPAFQVDVDKQSLTRRLQWVIQSRPAANPSRAQLKAVNVLFMSGPHQRRGGRRQGKG